MHRNEGFTRKAASHAVSEAAAPDIEQDAAYALGYIESWLAIYAASAGYLSPLLPIGWQAYFTVRRAGRYWGLSITCPNCSATPPAKLLGAQRWRWLAVHVAEHKPVKLVKGGR